LPFRCSARFSQARACRDTAFCYIVHRSIFAAAVTLTGYASLDLDSPRSGLIRLDAADRVLDALRAWIQPAWPAPEKRRAGAGPAL
jgi:hypothetical protein